MGQPFKNIIAKKKTGHFQSLLQELYLFIDLF